jgi:hypothetical protein
VFSLAGDLSVHWNTPRLVAASPFGGSRPLYGGVHEARGYYEIFFLYMDDSIIYRLARLLLRRLTLSHSDM